MAETNDNWTYLGEVPCFDDNGIEAEFICAIPLYVFKFEDEYMYKTVYKRKVYFIRKCEKKFGINAINAIFNPIGDKEQWLYLNVPRW